jgi:phosphoribosyl-ATP pyrophosphohydrolase
MRKLNDGTRGRKGREMPEPAKAFGGRALLSQAGEVGPNSLALQVETAAIRERARNPIPGSYTTKLLRNPNKIRGKMGEELVELVTARGKQNVIWEAADLLYFVQLYLVNRGVQIEDVLAEIMRRRTSEKKKERYAPIPKEGGK